MRLLWLSGLGLGLVAACGIAEIPGSAGASVVDGAACTAPITVEEQDVSQLTACACPKGGAAHCLEVAKIPSEVGEHLEACDTRGGAGACVPDTILEGSDPRRCASAGAEGRCLSLCVKTVADLGDLVTRGDGDACPEDERCIPCFEPGTRKPTGICSIGREATCAEGGGDAGGGGATSCPFVGTPMDVSRFAACGSGGRCVDEALLLGMVDGEAKKAEMKRRLAPCEGSGLCAPEEYLKAYGQHLPTECSSVAGIEGRCFSIVFRDVDAQKDVLSRDRCGERERCVPCYNPVTGEPTGACSTVSCDRAKTAKPPALTDCCSIAGETRGKCVPAKDVPSQYQTRLSTRECAGTELCAPSENLDPGASVITCDPRGPGSRGVCVSDCITLGLIEGVLIAQGTCPAAHRCIPCTNPTTGAPTGAPGC